jgi:hypothetical protein
MKPHATDDPGIRISPKRRRLLIVLIVIGLLIAIGWALTERAGAASPSSPATKVCTAWRSTCTASKTVFGAKVCYAWRFTCTKYAAAGKVAGLAAPLPAPLPCTCSANGRTWPCAIVFRRVGVKWLRSYACLPPRASKVSGLAAPAIGNRGGCKPSNYWTNIACTVTQASGGSVKGTCELGYTFAGEMKTKLKDGQPVSVSGCLDDKHALFDGGRKYPLVIKAR